MYVCSCNKLSPSQVRPKRTSWVGGNFEQKNTSGVLHFQYDNDDAIADAFPMSEPKAAGIVNDIIITEDNAFFAGK